MEILGFEETGFINPNMEKWRRWLTLLYPTIQDSLYGRNGGLRLLLVCVLIWSNGSSQHSKLPWEGKNIFLTFLTFSACITNPQLLLLKILNLKKAISIVSLIVQQGWHNCKRVY